MPYSITREDPERDLRALRAVLSGFPAGISSSAIPALQELADSIEEQVPKPAVEEPTEQWSVIRATPSWDGAEPREFTRLKGGFWVDHDGNECGPWESLSCIEVLRIGVGAGYNHPLQQLRDILFRFPDGEMANREGAEAYKALRREIGILLSESPASEQYGADPYKTGRLDTIDRLQKHLIQLRSSAITAERQDAYDKAIEAVEALS